MKTTRLTTLPHTKQPPVNNKQIIKTQNHTTTHAANHKPKIQTSNPTKQTKNEQISVLYQPLKHQSKTVLPKSNSKPNPKTQNQPKYTNPQKPNKLVIIPNDTPENYVKFTQTKHNKTKTTTPESSNFTK